MMLKMIKQVLTSLPVIILLLVVVGCGNDDTFRITLNKNFIAKHGAENFDQFRNYEAVLRSWDQDRDAVMLMVDTRQDTATCKYAYQVVVDHSKGAVKQAGRDKVFIKGNCVIDTVLCAQMAIKASSCDVTFLKVDAAGNVFVKTIYKESRPDLVHFADAKFITAEYQQKWRSLGNNWYERIVL